MTTLKHVAMAALFVGPALFAAIPANAITARQYSAQGQGFYTSSKGVREDARTSYSPQEYLAGEQRDGGYDEFPSRQGLFGGY